MSTVNKETKTLTMEQLAEMISKMSEKVEHSHSEIVQNQEKTAITMQGLEQRLNKMEGVQPKLDTEEKLKEAVNAVKPGMLSGFRQASTSKKVLIATVGTAAVAGAAYGTYKGVEYYKERKAMDLPLLAVEAVPAVSPAKADAVRQGLGLK